MSSVTELAKYTGTPLPVILERLASAREETDALVAALMAAVHIAPAAPAPAAPAPASASAGAGATPVRPTSLPVGEGSVDRVCASIERIILHKESTDRSSCSDIILLRKKEVIQWMFGDTSFLPAIHKKNKTRDIVENKKGEDEWGRSVMKERRPDLTLDGQWTNRFGEYIAEEMHSLLGKNVTKPVKKLHFQPDWETADAIVEVKAGTYFTTGTAHEKILGVPFKYADIPALYGKPLKVLCIGGAEPMARGYGLFPGEACTPARQRQLDFWREGGIEFIEATQLLLALSS